MNVTRTAPLATDELDVQRGVVAYIALTGGPGQDDPNPLWLLAEAAGWTLEEFVDDVLSVTAPISSAAIDHAMHDCV